MSGPDPDALARAEAAEALRTMFADMLAGSGITDYLTASMEIIPVAGGNEVSVYSRSQGRVRIGIIPYFDRLSEPETTTRGPGRPSWTPELFHQRLREATERTRPPHTPARLAPNFDRLDGTREIDPDTLSRLIRRFGPE